MTILFYRRSGGAADAPPLPASCALRLWSPGDQGPPPRGSRRPINWVWWAFERLTLFSRPGFCEVTIWRDGRRLHRLILTPRWLRFPFMGDDDLQIGDVWTAPDARGQGLARAALAAVQAMTGEDERLWYLADARNLASIALAEAAGYRLVGEGRRTRPLGLAALGRFTLDPPGGGPKPGSPPPKASPRPGVAGAGPATGRRSPPEP